MMLGGVVRWRGAGLAGLVAVLSLAAPALAQGPTPPKEATWAPYGAPAAEKLAADKVIAIRVAFIDGYGQQAGMIAFLRAPGEDPHVEARGVPRWDDGRTPDPVSAVLSDVAWTALVEDGSDFDRGPVKSPQSQNLCLHAWSVTVETVDAAGKVRRREEGACGGGTAIRYGFALAKAAVAALPICAALDPEKTRNAVTQLADCRLLAGDRAAAAVAFNRWNSPGLGRPLGPEIAKAIAYLFYDQAEVAWPGEPLARGAFEAAKAWSAHGQAMSFWPRRVIGETADRVRMEGVVMTWESGKPRTAPAEMLWTRENGFGFRIRRFKAE